MMMFPMALKAQIRKYEYYSSPSFLMGKVKTIETAGVGVKATLAPGGSRRRRSRRKKRKIHGP